MADSPLRKYEYRDVSAATSFRVNANRTSVPIGALIHTTEGTNSLKWLQGGSADAGSPASADYLITRSGLQYKLSPIGRFAYHAGNSQIIVPEGLAVPRRYINDKVSEALIGIEIESAPGEAITLEQYDSCADVIVKEAVINGWRWPYYIVGHYAVAVPQGRRSDPHGFDWGGFAGRLWARSKQQLIGGT